MRTSGSPFNALETVENRFRLTPPQRSALKKLGIRTLEDLLYHFPSRYDAAGDESAITGLAPGAEATVYGTIHKLGTRKSWKRKVPVGEAVITDASGSIKVMWFHQPYVVKKYSEGMFVKAVGTVGGTDGRLYLANPHVEPASPSDVLLFAKKGRGGSQLFAVYPESRGITSLWFRHHIGELLQHGAHQMLEDPIPDAIRTRYRLPDLPSALAWVHAPEKISHADVARKRFSFEEIFALQVSRARERAVNDAQRSFPMEGARERALEFLASLPFKPTGAQKRAILEILDDLAGSRPMARLLEGDVGAGKTLVAAAASYAVVTSRPPGRKSGTLQAAFMAPTEILAGQQFDSFVQQFRDLPISIGLITGSGCKKFPSKSSPGRATDISRTQLLKWVASGEIAMLVGTHALIQRSVKFQHLALAIVDEQHRFGTRQRGALAQKGDHPASRQAPLPHFLSMTATPIPRTLALTIYGDLDISVLDELPPGRVRITTKLLRPAARQAAYDAIRAEIAKGRQAYVICPRIDEPDPEKWNAVQAKSAKAEAVRLKQEVFPEFEIGLLHGAMKPDEKDEAMAAFARNETQVLVATSVVEVGINVPNATAMLIEGAERFGLAQLHQLRGRVQRSSHPPVCFLLTESGGEIAMKRLRALEGTDDGFKLAEADLESRGAGDLFGRKQWGVSDLGMEALKNVKLIQAARIEAHALIASDPELKTHDALRERVVRLGSLHGE